MIRLLNDFGKVNLDGTGNNVIDAKLLKSILKKQWSEKNILFLNL